MQICYRKFKSNFTKNVEVLKKQFELTQEQFETAITMTDVSLSEDYLWQNLSF